MITTQHLQEFKNKVFAPSDQDNKVYVFMKGEERGGWSGIYSFVVYLSSCIDCITMFHYHNQCDFKNTLLYVIMSEKTLFLCLSRPVK